MKKIAILTDSTADLSQDFREEHDIYSIPHYVRFEYEIYQDGINLVPDDLYPLIRQKRKLPKTSPATHEDYISFFERFLELGYDVLFIGIGSKFSTAIENVNLAKEEVESKRVYLVDSENISSGIGILVYKAMLMRKQNYGIKNIHQTILKLVPKVRSMFALKNPSFLVKGGRLGRSIRMIETYMGLKPIIRVKDGKLEMFKHPFGNMRHAMRVMLKSLYSSAQNLSLNTVMITHSLANRQALFMIAQIKKNLPDIEIIENRAGCVIATHCGSGAIGITYMLK
ncbi:MAG: DegV family protein [Acholeplasmataceae bacterium]|nr:DegV family protein [Acholeplasmataceae bacterium]